MALALTTTPDAPELVAEMPTVLVPVTLALLVTVVRPVDEATMPLAPPSTTPRALTVDPPVPPVAEMPVVLVPVTVALVFTSTEPVVPVKAMMPLVPPRIAPLVTI